jgi:hypothetical protein
MQSHSSPLSTADLPVPKSATDIAVKQGFMGSVVWVRWPHLLPARVMGVSSRKEMAVFDGQGGVSTIRSEKSWEERANHMKEQLRTARGIEVNKIDYMLHVQLSHGSSEAFTDNGTVVRQPVRGVGGSGRSAAKRPSGCEEGRVGKNISLDVPSSGESVALLFAATISKTEKGLILCSTQVPVPCILLSPRRRCGRRRRRFSRTSWR